MKIKNIISQTKLAEAPGNGQAAVKQPTAQLRAANNAFSSADIPSGMRDTLANGPTSRPGFAANTNREFVAKAGEMIGNAGATAEEIVASPWYSRWYNTFASGVKSVGGTGAKIIGKVALPLTVAIAMYDGYVQITDIDKNDPNRRNKIIAIVTKLVADYGFPAVAGYLGGLAGGTAGAFVGGIGAVPGAIIGDLAATAAAFLAQYEYGDDIDQAIEDLVDNVLMDAPAPAEAQPTTQTTYDAMGNVTGEEPITSPDATATPTPATRSATGTYTKPYDITTPATRSATGTYTKPYDIKPNPLVNPNTVADPVAQPGAKPKTATALTPAQELARQTSTTPKPATAPAAASTPSGTPPRTPTREPLPVTTYSTNTPTVPKMPTANLPKKPTTSTPPTAPTSQPNYDDLTFKQAFARARERARELDSGDAGKYTFMWHGKPYQTNYKGSGTARKPNEPYIPQSRQRGMMSTAPIKNPYENPKRKSISEAGGPKAWIGDVLVAMGERLAKLIRGGEEAAKVVKTVEKVADAVVGGRRYKYFEDVITGDSYWYDVEKAAAAGRKSAGRITKEADSALFDDLAKIRSADTDAAAATAAGKAADNASASVAPSERLTAKLSPKAIKALKDTDVELWTPKQLASLGYNKSHVPMLSAARKAGIDIVGTAEEMLASPWWAGWSKYTGAATKYAFKGSAWFAQAKMNLVFWGWMASDAFIEGFNRINELDPNDPNFKRRCTEIITEEAAKVGVEMLFYHGAGYLARYGLKTFGADAKWAVISELVVAISKGAGFEIANKYAMQGGALTGNIGIQDIVEMISDFKYGKLDRSPGAGTIKNSALYKKAYKWAIETGVKPENADDFATMVTKEGPNSKLASELDGHPLPFNESVRLAYLYNKLDESTNARNTVHIHNMIKRMLAESSIPDVLERTAYAIQQSGILNEAGGIYGGRPPVVPKSNVIPFAKPGQVAAKAAKALPAVDAANVAKLIKLPGMKSILKAVFFKVLPGLGFAISGYEAITKSLEGRWTDAFLNLASMGLNVAQVAGYLGGPVGAAASVADFAANLYLFRAPIMKLYYGVILGMDLSDYTDEDLEDAADGLIQEIATQLVTQLANGAANALGINEDVDPNDNFMTNVTAAIAANTKGDKAGAQKALDAAKLNNPATGSDQTAQQKVLDQITQANPGLVMPKTNPNSTQTNIEEAGGIGGGMSGGKMPPISTSPGMTSAVAKLKSVMNSNPREVRNQLMMLSNEELDQVSKTWGKDWPEVAAELARRNKLMNLPGKAVASLPAADAENVAKLIKSPSMMPIIKKVLWKAIPGIGAALQANDAWDQVQNGNWRNAFVDLGIAGINVAQVFGYLAAGAPGVAATIADITGNLYVNRSDIVKLYYGDILGLDLSNYTEADLENVADVLIREIATQLATQISNGVTGALGIKENVYNKRKVNVKEAGGIGGGLSGGAIHGQAVGGNAADMLQAYNEFAEQYPIAKFLLDIMPITGTATSVVDASQDLYNGKYGQAALDMLGALPGFKIGKYLSRGLQDAVKLVNKGAKVANVGNAASNLIDKTNGSASAATVPQSDKSAPMMESPKMGDQIMLELADGRVIVAPISELRGNSMIVMLDETGHQWLDESPNHAALKIGDGTQSISNTAQFWNSMIDTLAYDTPTGWAQLFVNLQNITGHAARTMPKQWANIWRQQHIALGDELTRGDMLVWIDEVEDAIDRSGLTESSHNPAGGDKLRKMLDSKDAAMLAVWMSSRAGNKGVSVAKFAKDKAVQSGLPANHWWGKIKHLVNETADPYSMEKRYYIVRKTSSAAPVDGISGFHQKSQAEKKLATMKNPDQYMVRAIDSTRLPKDEMKESRRSSDINFTPEDIAVLAGLTDLEDAKKHAIRLITRNSRRPMSAEKIKWFTHHINNSKSIRALTKMMYDMLLSGEGLNVIGTVGGMNPNSYRQTFKEDDDNDSMDEDETNITEAEYQGKTVPLSKPIRTSPSEGGKFKVYVKDPKTGNIKMVRFGDTTGLSIKRDDPARRKNYRARHHCDNPGPKTKANYWSCKMWTAKPVGKILKGK